MKFLAIIPARGGSKGILRKNLHPLLGKPLIEYSINAALESEKINQTFLTTDDAEILDHCRKFKIDFGYVRPVEYAKDTTPMWETVLHALDWLKKNKGVTPENFVLLQPTCPLRNAHDVNDAIEFFLKKGKPRLISVSEMFEHPYECVSIDKNGSWNFLREPKKPALRRQDFEEDFFFINGAIYISNTQAFRDSKLFSDKADTSLFKISRESGIDIDSIQSLKFAEACLTARK